MTAVAAPRAAAPGLQVEWLGRVDYADALALQEAAVAARRRGETPDRLLLLEHPPVVTLGRATRAEHLRVSRAELRARGVEVFEARRGGSVTYHGPGQLVGYLVADLGCEGRRDVNRLLRGIEARLARAVSALGVVPRCIPGRTGLFVDAPGPPRKIASIGLGLRGWVTWHGFALNVSLDLSGYDPIVPCGLGDVEMTSLEREIPGPVAPDLDARVRRAVTAAFAAELPDPPC